MADVFLSYARADRARAELVKAALERAGLSVFFDVEGLDGGDVFPDVLDREVKTAGAVVSLWSPHALSRPWLKQECSIGLKRKCLIPLAIEPLGDLDVPVAFEGLQQIDFTGFHGWTDSAEWRTLMRSLARTLGRPELVVGGAPPPASPRVVAREPGEGDTKEKRLWIVFGALAFVTVGAIAVNQYLSTNEIAALEEPADPADVTAGEAAVTAPEINSGTDEAFNTVVPIPWIEEEYPGQACGNLKVHMYFEFDKTSPDIASIVVLEEALGRGFNCELREVRVEGHDDLFNTPPYAQAVSERRASDVAGLLRSKGVDGAIISTAGYGSTDPLVPGERTPMNRRAVVFLDYEFRIEYPAPATPG